MARESIEEQTLAIRQKERELMDKEDAYFRNKRLLERRAVDLDERRRRFSNVLKQEQEKMTALLNRYQAHPDEAGEFYREVQRLQEESEQVYKQSIQNLEEEREEAKRKFNLERDQLEIQLQNLRRKEDSDTDELLYTKR